jgi:cysteine sulfinate desulfinase/cysteine desulfurase-like protein
VRLSIGRATTENDVDRAADILVHAVRRLRAALPPGAIERIA